METSHHFTCDIAGSGLPTGVLDVTWLSWGDHQIKGSSTTVQTGHGFKTKEWSQQSCAAVPLMVWADLGWFTSNWTNLQWSRNSQLRWVTSKWTRSPVLKPQAQPYYHRNRRGSFSWYNFLDHASGGEPSSQSRVQQRWAFLYEKWSNYKKEKLKRKLPVDSQLLDQMDRMDMQYNKNMSKLSANLDRLTNSIADGLALLRGLLLPQQPMYHPQQHPMHPPQQPMHPPQQPM